MRRDILKKMDILDLIKSRRNVKEFLPKFVDWDKLSKILDAARHAPSCGNIQNWKFIVIIDTSLKTKVAEGQLSIGTASAKTTVAASPGDSSKRTAALPSSIKDLPQMVGGC